MKKLISIGISIVLVISTSGIWAQSYSGEKYKTRQRSRKFSPEAVCAKARLDAKQDVNGLMWTGAGCLLGLAGVVISYIYAPSPPATALVNKSPEYVVLYTDCYKREAKKIQTKNAWTGCIISGLAETAFYTIYFLALMSTMSAGAGY